MIHALTRAATAATVAAVLAAAHTGRTLTAAYRRARGGVPA